MSGLFRKNNKKSEEIPKTNEIPVEAPVEEKGDATDEFLEYKMRTHLAAARIKPHYVGNVLSSIYYLCDMDTEVAKETILAFSGYLRQASEAFKREEMLPFSWELEQVQNYVTLEKLRFEDRLNVKYEIDIDDFELPPITMQPLMENAIKHGLAPLKRPCLITVSTKRLVDGGIEIKVTDDGVGFDTKILEEQKDEPKSLECIRHRVKKELGGEMKVESKPDEGTTVTITLKP